MLWWIGAFFVWLISAAWIFFLMADVIRGKSKGTSLGTLMGYGFHGATAVLALWMVTKAMGL